MSSSSSAESSSSLSPETPAALYNGPARGVFSLKYQAFWMAERAKSKGKEADEKTQQKKVQRAWLKQCAPPRSADESLEPVPERAPIRAVDTLVRAGSYDLPSPVETPMEPLPIKRPRWTDQQGSNPSAPAKKKRKGKKKKKGAKSGEARPSGIGRDGKK
ncbi:hypothetical protein JCM1841_005490 [Sporobolomyces salmonicolor]